MQQMPRIIWHKMTFLEEIEKITGKIGAHTADSVNAVNNSVYLHSLTGIDGRVYKFIEKRFVMKGLRTFQT